jgi:cysteinyl-tRNA synthetase
LPNHSKEALRFFLLSAHYRTPLDFSDQNLIQGEAAIHRIGEFVERIKVIADQETSSAPSSDITAVFKKDFVAAIDDDFNTPHALAALFDLIRQSHTAADEQKLTAADARALQDALGEVNAILGIIPAKTASIPEEIKKIVQERETLRQNKDFSSADALRQKISDLGYQVEDTNYGPLVKIKK